MPTPFTELVSVRHPIALAPMGGAAGGVLTAAVSKAGGFGILGAGRQDRAWVERELATLAGSCDRPWGVGFQTWSADPDTVALALEAQPTAVMLSFGDPETLGQIVHQAGVLLFIQVTNLEETRHALHVGAHLIVAQGSEAGGHGGQRATLPLVPAVLDLAGSVPVLAAGGIADGRGLAAALALGAAGALVGTRFLVSQESLAETPITQAILAASGDDTVRSKTMDIAVSTGWPDRYTARVVKNDITNEWGGRDDELAADNQARGAYRTAFERGDLAATPVWAGEDIDLIQDAPSAEDIVAAMAREAASALEKVRTALRP